jgi:hypothetical protein
LKIGGDVPQKKRGRKERRERRESERAKDDRGERLAFLIF